MRILIAGASGAIGRPLWNGATSLCVMTVAPRTGQPQNLNRSERSLIMPMLLAEKCPH